MFRAHPVAEVKPTVAHPVEFTLSTGNKVVVNYQSQEVSVSVTYQLERGDDDLLAVVGQKADEVVAVHRLAWARVRGEAGGGDNATPDARASPDEENTSSSPADDGGIAAPAESSCDEFLSGAQLAAIEALFVQGGWSQSRMEERLIEEFGKSEITELTVSQASQLLVALQREARHKAQNERQLRRLSINPNGHC